MIDNFMLLVATSAAGVGAAWVYREYVQKVPLFDLEEPAQVFQTAAWLPDREQHDLLTIGVDGITRHQWKTVKQRVMKEVNRQLGDIDPKSVLTTA